MRDVTITGNRFIECGSPVIGVRPETDRNEGAVHSGVRVIDNEFVMREGVAVETSGCSDVTVKGNKISGNHDAEPYKIGK